MAPCGGSRDFASFMRRLAKATRNILHPGAMALAFVAMVSLAAPARSVSDAPESKFDGATHCAQPPQHVPSLDQMSGDWMPASIVTNLPDVNNFHDMIIVARDLTSYYCYFGGLFTHTKDPLTQWKIGYPLVKMTLDGVEYQAADFRWYAYRALRRNQDCAGLSVESDTRMVNEQRGVLCQVRITNNTKAAKDFQLALHVPGKLDAGGVMVLNATQNPRTTSALAPSRQPDQVKVDGDAVVWQWKLTLAPGAATELGYAAGDGSHDQTAATQKNVAAWAGHFHAEMNAFEGVWKQRWADAFTPGNSHFSGNFPVLDTDNASLSRNYYMGALTMLDLERTQFPIPRAFITSGERSEGIQYYWDASMAATAWALLEPHDMKAVLRRWLAQNPRGSVHINLRDASGFDAKHYDAITGYAADACTTFATVDTYLRVTGDRAFLDEKMENGKTVIDCLNELAADWETLPRGPDGLVNFGNNGKLLETGPQYVECVAAFNAQNVWLMRRAADWDALKGHAAAATELRQKADKFLPAVLALYNKDTGAWNLRKVDGTTVPVQHCVDFIYAGDALCNDLSAQQKTGAINFAKRELFTNDWMRAMSLKDPNYPKATRPDHAYTGSYDGWIPLTAAALWRLGGTQDAFAFYCRTAAVTKEGPFAQAHEFYGPAPTSNEAPVRVALRGSNMKECISGAAFADVVMDPFFGFDPAPDGQAVIIDPHTPRPFQGTLSAVRYNGQLLTIKASEKGIVLERP